jgi:hypothetical protein
MIHLDDELDLPSSRGRPPKVDLRQPLAPTSEPNTRSDSWWEHASRSGFTERAQQEHDRMSRDVIGRKVPDQIMGKYIGLVRPTE